MCDNPTRKQHVRGQDKMNRAEDMVKTRRIFVTRRYNKRLIRVNKFSGSIGSPCSLVTQATSTAKFSVQSIGTNGTLEVTSV